MLLKRVEGLGGALHSEEGSDDSAEERAIREGFIVDDDEDGERRKKHKKRRKHKSGDGKKMKKLHDELGELDEDDLDLIGIPTSTQPGAGARKLRRLREGSIAGSDDLDNMANMFADEDGGARDDLDEDDMDDFIADEDDEEDGARERRQQKAQQQGAKGKKRYKGLKGIDREAWEEISDIFGTGDEYAWAMELDPTEEEIALEPQLTDVRRT